MPVRASVTRRVPRLAGLFFLLGCSAISLAEVASPLSPEDSLAHLHVAPGLSVELVACEPQVIDPIAMRFDEDGRLWVVEMRDYPHGPPDGQPPLSQIRVLADDDRDGRDETSTLFADELLFPTGLQPWRGGVFVTLAEAVVYLKDTDGDGRADVREPWFHGFTAENPQLRANHPRLTLDGRITIANGLRGGAVVDARQSADDAKPLSISGRDFAFDPRTGAFEAVSGNGQFGNGLDDFGNRFVCNNRAPVQHVVLENAYTARNPLLAIGSVVSDVAPAGEQSRVFPLVAAWTTSNLHAGQFTAACGVTIYRGDALPDEFHGNAFICEPTGSLVHRENPRPPGSHLRFTPVPRRARVPGQRRPVVPAGESGNRTRRRALRGGHGSGRDRTSPVHAQRTASKARSARRRRSWSNLPHRSGRRPARACQSRFLAHLFPGASPLLAAYERLVPRNGRAAAARARRQGGGAGA